jgi:hypothetical protein
MRDLDWPRRLGRPRRGAVRVGTVVVLVASGLVGFAGRVDAAGPLAPVTLAQVGFNVGETPLSVEMGDLDGDGDLDLVAAVRGSDSVSVALGHGDGTFAAPVAYATADGPDTVAIGDLDGDGDLDLVTTDLTTLSVLFGNGDGTFAAPAVISFAAIVGGVKAGDVDEDGDLDLAITLSGGASILLGNGDGTFATPYTVHAPSNGSVVPTLADVNGDTHLDLVTAETANRISVLLGDGAGAFTPHVSLIAETSPGPVKVADLDGDSDADLVAPSSSDHSVSVNLGNGDGSFASRVVYDSFGGDEPVAVALGDLNGDTFPDIAIADRFLGSMVRLGIGDGTFGLKADLIRGGTGTAIAMGDLNGDTWLDVAIAKLHPLSEFPDFVVVGVNTGGLALDAPVASAGSQGVTVTWTPPDADSTVVGYTVVVEGAHDAPLPVVTYSPTTTSAVVTNLINGSTYTFRVVARNAVGDGPRSGASNPVVSATGLGAPTIGTATQDGFGGIAVSWTAPTEDGGSPVTGYVVNGYIGYFPALATIFNSTATTQSITTGLESGATYRFRVRAMNAYGTSFYSRVTNPITAAPMAPQAPTSVTAVAGNSQATVSWTAPHPGGTAITGYVVTAYNGYFPFQTRSYATPSTTQVFPGLTNGTTYRFRVQAVNAVGTGGYSKVSNPVTPTP